jgi:hypothetical protein
MGKETSKAGKKPAKPAGNSNRTAKKAPGKPFAPGKSGNPEGRPKIPEDVKEAFRALTPEAVATLAEIMRNDDNTGNRLRASEIILNRAWGTPAQSVALTDGEGGPLEVIVRYVDRV